jgi:hypothetical protein
MKNQSLLLLATFFSISVFSQQTRFYTDPEEKFKEAKEYLKDNSVLYPLFKNWNNRYGKL